MFRFMGGGRLIVVAGLLAAGLAAVVAVQASASGGSATKVPTVPRGLSLKQQAARAQAQLAAHPQAAATNVHCGQTITATTTLNGDLNCSGQNGLTIGANGITLNLGGHTISGSPSVGNGVSDPSNSDTIENGYISGFANGVYATGTSDVVTTLQVNYSGIGIVLSGTNEKATSNTAAENSGTGLYANGSGDTVQSNHLLNNGDGLLGGGDGDKFLDNVVDGNTLEGISVNGFHNTLTGNTANYNTDYGIQAFSPQIDGGTNKATGNTNSHQCYGVVCAPE